MRHITVGWALTWDVGVRSLLVGQLVPAADHRRWRPPLHQESSGHGDPMDSRDLTFTWKVPPEVCSRVGIIRICPACDLRCPPLSVSTLQKLPRKGALENRTRNCGSAHAYCKYNGVNKLLTCPTGWSSSVPALPHGAAAECLHRNVTKPNSHQEAIHSCSPRRRHQAHPDPCNYLLVGWTRIGTGEEGS